MAIMMGKFMVNWFHGAGELEAALADSNKTMGQPFVLQIAKDYFASLAADKERAELESLIADQDRMAEANPHAVDIAHAAIESARDATRSLRI